jgi:hypothetical protein
MVVARREAKYGIDYLIAFTNRLQKTANLLPRTRAGFSPLFLVNDHSVEQAMLTSISSLSAAIKMGRLRTDFPFDMPRLAGTQRPDSIERQQTESC